MGWYILLACLVILLFYPLTAEITFSLGLQEENSFRIFWRPLGSRFGPKIPIYHKSGLKLGGILKRSEKKEPKTKDFLQHHQWLKAIKVKKLHLDFTLGLEDAAQTALAAGSLNMLLGMVFPILDGLYGMFKSRPFWQVRPVFGRYEFSCRGQCILISSWGDIILRGSILWAKNIRRNRHVWRNRNQVADGNSFGKP
jgi:hypothetical protein